MSPGQMQGFSQSIVAVSLFASNILFWRQSGYFDAAAEEKPLLHTWSLAVEEQYYLLFPVFLIIASRFGKDRVFWMIVIMAAISLTLSEWGWRNKPDANFYLAPSRVWELFAGSISAFIVQRQGVKKNNALALFGLGAILFAIVAYDESTPFPSAYALVPVLGVVLIILYADADTIAAKVLSAKTFVGIGLISYSAYLWHQPLFAFARIRSLDHPPAYLMMALSLLSLALAYLSWKYIETPFRQKTKLQRKHIFTLSFIGLIAFTSFGVIGHQSNGFTERFNPGELKLFQSATGSPLRHTCHFPQTNDALKREACTYYSGKATIAVVGNSHGTELAYALANALKDHGRSIVHHTMSGCNHNYRKSDEADSICYAWHENVVRSLINNSDIETVVLSYRNESYIHVDAYRQSLLQLADTLILAGKRVILVLQAPLPGAHIDKYIMSSSTGDGADIKGLSRSEWGDIYNDKNKLLQSLHRNVEIIDPTSLLCDADNCYVTRNGIALYFDYNHLSVHGAAIVADHIVKKLQQK